MCVETMQIYLHLLFPDVIFQTMFPLLHWSVSGDKSVGHCFPFFQFPLPLLFLYFATQCRNALKYISQELRHVLMWC